MHKSHRNQDNEHFITPQSLRVLTTGEGNTLQFKWGWGKRTFWKNMSFSQNPLLLTCLSALSYHFCQPGFVHLPGYFTTPLQGHWPLTQSPDMSIQHSGARTVAVLSGGLFPEARCIYLEWSDGYEGKGPLPYLVGLSDCKRPTCVSLKGNK